jgi:hypothetical protein
MSKHWENMKPEKQLMGRVAFTIVAAISFVIAIHGRLANALPDDASFFLRYAQNMAHGYFWVWNQGEAPVWGASAPLFPLFLAVPIALGAPLIGTAVWVSITLSTLGLTATAVILQRRFGWIAGIAFVALASLDTGLMFFAGSALETPLTILLLAFGLYVLLEQKGDVAAGIAIGLLAVNKLDLVPVAGLLFIAYSLTVRRFATKAFVVAAIVTAAWYGFAWVYFGLPVPNSFVTKAMLQNDLVRIIDWRWFYTSVFVKNGHWMFDILALFGVWHCAKGNRPLLLVAIGLLVTHTAAYTIKYPFEPYDWYLMPSIFTLIVLASIGVEKLAGLVRPLSKSHEEIPMAIGMVLLLVIVVAQFPDQYHNARWWKLWVDTAESDRADAGQWVSEHTPTSFRVASGWGNPALFSNRFEYDLSYLNRRPEKVNALAFYKPEILIMQNAPTATPMTPQQSYGGYKAVKVFDKTFASGETNMFFTVYARTDVIPQMTGVSFPIATSCASLEACQKYQPATPTKPTETVPASLQPDGPAPIYCYVDTVNGMSSGSPDLKTRNRMVSFAGWGMMNPNFVGSPVVSLFLPDAIFLKISGEGKTYYYRARDHLGRADVALDMGLPRGLGNSGFDGLADLSDLAPGNYAVSVILNGPEKSGICTQRFSVAVGP